MNKVLSIQQAMDFINSKDIVSGIFSNPVKKQTSCKKIKIRKILIKSTEQYQIERFENTKVFHKNILQENLADLIQICFADFKNAEFKTLTQIFIFMQNNKNDIRLLIKENKSLQETQSFLHNKQKDYLLPLSPPPYFLKKLNFFTEAGDIVNSKYHKFKQINKYLEFIESILPQLSSSIKLNKNLNIVDFGCGKAYLSFALYHYLTNIKKMPVSICGLDLKSEVIEFCNTLAAECNFTNLNFKIGDIGNFEFKNTPDMVISLHACNTATDLALAQAIKSNAKIIFAVPCCQHEINTQIRQNKLKIKKSSNPLSSLFDYGIITEKFSSLLTDTLRAKLLEAAGYRVNIEEFIDTEHTPKNILIKAIKIDKPTLNDIKEMERAQEEITSIKNTFFINITLEKLLSIGLSC